MNDHFKGFLNIYLDLEQAYDVSGYLRPTLMSFSDSYVKAVRSGFIEILQDDSFGPADYERLTNIEFSTQAEMRKYLQDLYAYLFEGAPEQPLPTD